MVSKRTPLVHLFICRLPPFFVSSFEFIYLFIHQFCSPLSSLIYFITVFYPFNQLLILHCLSLFILLSFCSLSFTSSIITKNSQSHLFELISHFLCYNSGLISPFLELMFFFRVSSATHITQNAVGLNRAFLER